MLSKGVREPLSAVGENVKWCRHSGKQCDGFSGMKNRTVI